MEFWLISGNNNFQLPVNPPEISLNDGTNNDTVNSLNLGEINLGGNRKLVTFSFTSFFPAHIHPYLEYSNIKTPLESVNLIRRWNENNSIVRFMVTGTSINTTCTIDTFVPKWQAGTDDVDYQLDLKEYRSLNNKDNTYYTPDVNTYSIAKQNSTYRRQSGKPQTKPTTYTVKVNDTLMTISKKIYGTTNKWKDLAGKNNIKDPAKLTPGQKLVI